MESGFNLVKFGHRITHLREKRGYTPFELSAESEVEQGIIEAFEEGKLAPRMEHIRALAETLAVSEEFLLGLGDSPERSQEIIVPESMTDIDQLELLEMVLKNETGWHARGFIAPTELEKAAIRDGFTFRIGPPRELIEFYWDVLPFLLSRIRLLNLLSHSTIET